MYYDFKCTACGQVFEKEKSMKDSSNEKCLSCGEEAIRVITGGAGVLAGGLSKSPFACPSTGASCPSAHKCGMVCSH